MSCRRMVHNDNDRSPLRWLSEAFQAFQVVSSHSAKSLGRNSFKKVLPNAFEIVSLLSEDRLPNPNVLRASPIESD